MKNKKQDRFPYPKIDFSDFFSRLRNLHFLATVLFNTYQSVPELNAIFNKVHLWADKNAQIRSAHFKSVFLLSIADCSFFLLNKEMSVERSS